MDAYLDLIVRYAYLLGEILVKTFRLFDSQVTGLRISATESFLCLHMSVNPFILTSLS